VDQANEGRRKAEETPVDDVRRVREKLSKEASDDVRRLGDHARQATALLREKLDLRVEKP